MSKKDTDAFRKMLDWFIKFSEDKPELKKTLNKKLLIK